MMSGRVLRCSLDWQLFEVDRGIEGCCRFGGGIGCCLYWWTDEVDRGVKGLTCRGFYGLVFEGEGGVGGLRW